jgi:hypothetical protein
MIIVENIERIRKIELAVSNQYLFINGFPANGDDSTSVFVAYYTSNLTLLRTETVSRTGYFSISKNGDYVYSSCYI